MFSSFCSVLLLLFVALMPKWAQQIFGQSEHSVKASCIVSIRSSASSNSAHAQLQALKDSVARLTSERDALKKEMETKNNDILEKNRTITQVKKIGRRYKTQYDELKVQHDKVWPPWWKQFGPIECGRKLQ